MSSRRLPRARGTQIRCDYDGCKSLSQTGQIFVSLHRVYLATAGWTRGMVRGSRSTASHLKWDICPEHVAAERAEADDRRRQRAAKAEEKAEARKRRRELAMLTSDQRRERRNAKARERRAAKRQQATKGGSL